MIKTIKTMSKQEKERYTVPRKVQDVIPVRRIWPDGIFLVGNKFSKTYKFSDINYSRTNGRMVVVAKLLEE